MEPENSTSKTSTVGKYIALLVVVVLLVSMATGFIWFVKRLESIMTESPTVSTTQPAPVPEIKSDAQLKKLEDEVRNINFSDFAKDLDANDADAKDF